MSVQKPIIPECRYGHGELRVIVNNGRTPEWAVGAWDGTGNRTNEVFALKLFMCPQCGYSEFFDGDADKTIADQEKK